MWSLFSHLKPYLLRESARIALTYAAMIVLAITSGAYAALTGPALKALFLGSTDLGKLNVWLGAYALYVGRTLWFIPCAIVGVAILKGAAQATQFYVSGQIAQRVVNRLLLAIFSHLLCLPPDCFTHLRAGDVASRFTADVRRVEEAIFYGLAPIVRDSLAMVVLLGVCVYLDPYLSLFTFVIVPLLALPIARFSKHLKKIALKSQAQTADIAHVVSEAVQGMRTVQAYGMEPAVYERLSAALNRAAQAGGRSYWIRAIRSPVTEIVSSILAATLLYFMSKNVRAGTSDGAHVASFATAALMMYEPIKKLGNVGDYVAQGLAALERLLEMSALPMTQGAHGLHQELFSSYEHETPHHRLGIEFKDVSFAYQSNDAAVLSGINFKIPPGATYALVGHSGAGKSTLMQLLLRFNEPRTGAILLGERAISQWDLRELRRQFAFVSQDVFLFNDTVRANLCAGQRISQARLNQALDDAALSDVISRLPQGLETILGERGMTLSGGERQRLAIARAFLRDAPILLLDEATSALDSTSERVVHSALARLMKGRTVFVIAHRLSTIQHADQIIVLSQGQIVQMGAHALLMRESGEYRLFAEQQFGRTETEGDT